MSTWLERKAQRCAEAKKKYLNIDCSACSGSSYYDGGGKCGSCSGTGLQKISMDDAEARLLYWQERVWNPFMNYRRRRRLRRNIIKTARYVAAKRGKPDV